MVFKRILTGLSIAVFTVLTVGCSQSEASHNSQNSNEAAATRPGPDNSEITTSVDANGVRTETRTFRDNSRVSKVVVTTRNGQRTARVHSRSGEEKDIDNFGDALEATGDKLADGAGWTANQGEKIGREVGDKAEDAGDKAKSVAGEVGDKAEDVGEKTVDTAKTVGKKVGEGAKKTGKAIKKAVTP